MFVSRSQCRQQLVSGGAVMQLPDMKPLEALRLAGKRPAGAAWLWLGDYAPTRWDRWADSTVEIAIPRDAAIERLDLRPLVGLRVIVVADTYDRPLLRFLEHLKGYAVAIECFIVDWLPNDLGMRWERGQADDWLGIGEQEEKQE